MFGRHAFVAGALAVIAVSFATPASAELLTPTGGKGQLVLEQIAGFRAGGAPGGSGISFAGFLGFNYGRYTQDNGQGGYTANNYTSFWVAPSADFFPIDHLSIGGLLELSMTSSSFDQKQTSTAPVVNTSLPTTTNFTILPRVGWMFGIGDRFGIWPRVGAGYASRQTASTRDPNDKTTFSGFVLDADVSFILRVNETFFVNLTPEFTFLPGSASVTNGTITSSVSASYTSFSVLGGIGVIL
jgi:hypothetical protein